MKKYVMTDVFKFNVNFTIVISFNSQGHQNYNKWRFNIFHFLWMDLYNERKKVRVRQKFCKFFRVLQFFGDLLVLPHNISQKLMSHYE